MQQIRRIPMMSYREKPVTNGQTKGRTNKGQSIIEPASLSISRRSGSKNHLTRGAAILEILQFSRLPLSFCSHIIHFSPVRLTHLNSVKKTTSIHIHVIRYTSEISEYNNKTKYFSKVEVSMWQ